MNGLKIKFLVLVGLTAFLATTTARAEETITKQIAVSVMDVYVPSTLQAGQDAYIVVNGLFPNTCYSLGIPDVRHIDDFTHQIRTIANVKSGICMRVFVPFNEEIQLGTLKVGTHKLKFAADDDTYFEKELVVK